MDSFQTIILTHNREYFIWAKHELENRDLLNNGDWEILEMYVDELDEDNEHQRLTTRLDKALEVLNYHTQLDLKVPLLQDEQIIKSMD